MDSSKSIWCFNRMSNVQGFLTKVEIHAPLKGNTREKVILARSSKLEGPAFNEYLRLSAEDREDPRPERLKAVLIADLRKEREIARMP